ncbi:MAG: hypothetical protein AAF337_06415 [Pseudomonadota bacterium]
MRSFFASLAGIISAGLVVFVLEQLGHVLFAPAGALPDPSDAQAMAEYVTSQPLPAKLWLVLAWSMGATSGCFIGTRIGQGQALPAALVAAFILLGIVSKVMAIPHPLWLTAAGIFAVALSSLAGYRLGLGPAAPRQNSS